MTASSILRIRNGYQQCFLESERILEEKMEFLDKVGIEVNDFEAGKSYLFDGTVIKFLRDDNSIRSKSFGMHKHWGAYYGLIVRSQSEEKMSDIERILFPNEKLF